MLRTDGARIPVFVQPLDGERMSPGKAAGIAHCCDHHIVGDQRIDVGDEDLAEMSLVFE